MSAIFDAISGGTLCCQNGDCDVSSAPWNRHPAFAGVELKHVVTAAETGGMFSAHLVRIAPGKSIGLHTHEGQWELHEVADGAGVFVLEGRKIPYVSGSCAVMPAGVPHEVRAGDTGLEILAKFIPALL